MMKLKTEYWILILATFLVSRSKAQEFSLGRCPPFPTVKNFEAAKYTGTWYEYSNYFAFFQLFGKCVTATYTLAPGNDVKINILNKAINQLTGAKQEAKGTAVLNDPYDPLVPGELVVNFEEQPAFTRARSTNYNIIDTDYENFSIVYSCNNIGFVKSEILWILTRERFPSQYLINHLYKKIRTLGLDTRRLKKTDQKTCGVQHG